MSCMSSYHHRTAPVDVRERVVFPSLPALRQARPRPDVAAPSCARRRSSDLKPHHELYCVAEPGSPELQLAQRYHNPVPASRRPSIPADARPGAHCLSVAAGPTRWCPAAGSRQPGCLSRVRTPARPPMPNRLFHGPRRQAWTETQIDANAVPVASAAIALARRLRKFRAAHGGRSSARRQRRTPRRAPPARRRPELHDHRQSQ